MTHRRRLLPAAALLGGALLGAAACDGLLERERAVLLPITGVTAPATLQRTSPLAVTVQVTSGGCRRLERVSVDRAANRATITARGRETYGPGVTCTADIRMEPRTVTIPPPFGDSLVISAWQGGGAALTRVVRAN